MVHTANWIQFDDDAYALCHNILGLSSFLKISYFERVSSCTATCNCNLSSGTRSERSQVSWKLNHLKMRGNGMHVHTSCMFQNLKKKTLNSIPNDILQYWNKPSKWFKNMAIYILLQIQHQKINIQHFFSALSMEHFKDQALSVLVEVG